MKFKRALIYSEKAENVGDIAIMMSTRLLLSSMGINKIGVSQWVKPDSLASDIFERECVQIVSSKSPSSIVSSIGALHVIGGGQLVRDNQSEKDIALLLARIRIGKITGGRVVALGLGASNLQNEKLRKLWKSIFACCDVICVRDENSFHNVLSLGGSPKLAGDLVFLLDDLFSNTSVKRDTIVISPCIDVGEGRQINTAHIASLVEQAKKRFSTSRIAFALHDATLDKRTMEIITKKTGIVADEILSNGKPEDFAALYARSSLTITNRLHSVIFSLKAKAPVVCLNDGGKIEAAVKEIGLASMSIADINSNSTAEMAIDEAVSAVSAIECIVIRAQLNRSELKRVALLGS